MLFSWHWSETIVQIRLAKLYGMFVSYASDGKNKSLDIA